MSKSSRDYWREREEEALKHYIQDEAEYDREIKAIYQRQLDSIQEQIDAFYGRYAGQEGISLAEAKKRVSKLDIAAYERKAKRYVKEKNFSKRANEEMRLYNATMKINRMEMLKANIGLELLSGTDELEKYMADILQGRAEDELKRQAGILGKTVKNNAQKAHAIVNSSFHNATFSDRIWLYQDLLRNQLAGLLQSGLIQGKNPRALARDLKKATGASTYNAERLMRTEMARVQTEAQKQSFIRNGFDEYEFIANSSCCEECQALNGKHFKVSKMMPGENAAPLHPHCRCSTAAYEDSEEYEAWLDYLDKGGSTKEWNDHGKAEWKRLQISAPKQTGGKETGGKHYVPDDPDNKKDVAAARAYRGISRVNDIKTIAQNTGFSEEEIRQIRRHIFFEKHKLYDGYGMLSPDYDMAVAWLRLRSGKFLDRDITLLRHELLESQLEKKYNLTISEAHARATAQYDWAQQLHDEMGEGGEPDDLLQNQGT